MQRNTAFWPYALVLVLLLPSVCIWPQHGHDWGDDFALYIIQAHEMVGQWAIDAHGYIYNPLRPTLGPPEYPWGLPALLAPVIALFGNDMAALQAFFKLIHLALFVSIFGIWRQWLPWWVAATGTLALAYNPIFLELRTEVMSDLPFTLWVVVCLSLLTSGHRWATIGAMLAGMAAVITREAGVALALGLCATWVLLRIWPERCISHVPLQRLALVSGTSLLAFIAQRFMAPPGYGHQFDHYDLTQVLATNAEYLTEVMAYRLFLYTYDQWHPLAILGIASCGLVVVIGFMITARSAIGPAHLVLVAFLGMFLLFPFSSRGFRFIVPLLPFLFLFGLMALRAVPRVGPTLAMALPLLVLQQNHEQLMRMVRTSPFVPEGPQRTEAVEAFTFVRDSLPAHARLLFIKPRALALYTHRAAMCPPDDSLAVHLSMQMDTARISHIVLYDRLPDPVTENWIRSNACSLLLRYDRGGFRVWEIHRTRRSVVCRERPAPAQVFRRIFAFGGIYNTWSVVD